MLAKTALRAAVGAVLLSVLWASGCEDPLAAFAGITTDSDFKLNHNHRLTVPARDIELAPNGDRTYTTSSADTPVPHAHQVLLRAEQLATLQQDGAVVDVLSSSELLDANRHSHVFSLVR